MQEHARYLKFLFAGMLALLLAVGAWSHHAMKTRLDALSLVSYQQKKLARLDGPLGTLFVGDSALGNAIDASVFSALSGSPSLNLALTQSHGFAGSWEMMRRTLRVSRPRNVVVMQTVDLLKRETDDTTYLLFSDDDSIPVPWGRRLHAYLEYLQLLYGADTLKRLVADALHGDRETRPWPDDYVPQSGRLEAGPGFAEKNTLKPGHNPEKLRFLREIVKLCEAERLNCIYVHGPLLGTLCPGSQAYFTEAAGAIRATGMRLLADTPLCVPEDAIGDSVSHLHASKKAEYTRIYHGLLAPLLR